MRLKIVTPTRILVDAEVGEITAPGTAGEFGVLPEHVTFLGHLDLGVMTYTDDKGEARSVVLHGGYAEVLGEDVTVLADDAEFPDEIDIAEAKANLAQVESDLDKATDSSDEVDALLQARKLAEARIAAAS
jgi:F-type H+-transporting ATPase subunit epsilon